MNIILASLTDGLLVLITLFTDLSLIVFLVHDIYRVLFVGVAPRALALGSSEICTGAQSRKSDSLPLSEELDMCSPSSLCRLNEFGG